MASSSAPLLEAGMSSSSAPLPPARDPILNYMLISAITGKWETLNQISNLDANITRRLDLTTGHTVLHLAAKYDNYCYIEEVLKKKPTMLEIEDQSGNTPLHLTCEYGKVRTLKKFLEFPCCHYLLLTGDCKGNMPIHKAMASKKVFMVIEILKHAPESYNLRNMKGDTFLHSAVKAGDRLSIQFLIIRTDLRRTMRVTDKFGQTPYELALFLKFDRIADILLQFKDKEPRLDMYTSSGPDTELKPMTSGSREALSSAVQPGEDNNDENIQHTSAPGVPLKVGEEMIDEELKNIQNTSALVSVLIATVTFAAGINPPGGFVSLPAEIWRSDTALEVFIVCDAISFFLAMTALFVLMINTRMKERATVANFVSAIEKMLWASAIFMNMAFISGVWSYLFSAQSSVAMYVFILVCGILFTRIVFYWHGWIMLTGWIQRCFQKYLRSASPESDRASPDSDSATLLPLSV